ncbi:hypothetical protein [Vibrio agarivorans]|uniref:Uncharacterized protein n=1 Tax=Vibrio agarivorans TaxID=153622 RepID=A0ABT7XW47_9VIBR|nr:hypothetical protein [Vibrio agarivorans]MDN2479994.1 hypothetical protein [Vibrio agarivorans]
MSFVFFYPTINKKIGGAQRLVVSFAKSLSSMNHSVKIIDYRSGYCFDYFSNNPKDLVEVIALDEYKSMAELSLDNVFDEDNWVLFNNDYINFSLNDNIKGNILFYDLLYPNMSKLFSTRYGDIPILSKYSRKIFFKKIIDKEALCVVDVEANLWLDYNVNKHVPLVNIPVEKKSHLFYSLCETLYTSDYFVYVSRACDWKVMPFLKVIEDIFEFDNSVQFKIYTDDAMLFDSIIRKNTSEKVYASLKANCNYFEGVDMEEIMRTTRDGLIHFGMASVAVEFAMNGFFTISLDLSRNKLPSNYTYRYIYDGHDEGCITQDLSDDRSTQIYLEKGKSLKLVIDDAKSTEAREKVIVNSKDFCERNHYSENVTKKLIMLAQSSKLKFDSYLDALNSAPLYRIYKARKMLLK